MFNELTTSVLFDYAKHPFRNVGMVGHEQLDTTYEEECLFYREIIPGYVAYKPHVKISRP